MRTRRLRSGRSSPNAHIALHYDALSAMTRSATCPPTYASDSRRSTHGTMHISNRSSNPRLSLAISLATLARTAATIIADAPLGLRAALDLGTAEMPLQGGRMT